MHGAGKGLEAFRAEIDADLDAGMDALEIGLHIGRGEKSAQVEAAFGGQLNRSHGGTKFSGDHFNHHCQTALKTGQYQFQGIGRAVIATQGLGFGDMAAGGL